MESILMKSLLYDFYSDLLTDKQRWVYEMRHLNDLSLTEIGLEYGITPQAVKDILRRTENNLLEYELKLKLIERYEKNQAVFTRIMDILDNEKYGNESCELKRLVRELHCEQ